MIQYSIQHALKMIDGRPDLKSEYPEFVITCKLINA